jgi:DDE superfamily endonuclease
LTCFSGKNPDIKILKANFPNTINWFENKKVWVDGGFKGIDKYYEQKGVFLIPERRPYKTKNNPNPEMEISKKEHNLNISKNRVVNENSIGGMKTFAAAQNKYKGRKKGRLDDLLVLCAGLWNFKNFHNVLKKVKNKPNRLSKIA